MRRALLLLLALCACGQGPAPPLPEAPRRVVSLDHCADQYVLRLAPREAILALSPRARGDYSHERARAEGIPTVRASAEDVLLLRPDLVVRSYGGGPGAAEFFRRAGVPVLEIGWPESLEGVAENTERIADALGAPSEGLALAAEMRRQIGAREPAGEPPVLLYLTPSGVTTGPGSLVAEAIEAGGGQSYERRPGWHDLPLERLLYEPPDGVVAAFFDTKDRFEGRWSTARHPVLQEALDGLPRVDLPGSLLACAAPPLGEAARLIAGGAF